CGAVKAGYDPQRTKARPKSRAAQVLTWSPPSGMLWAFRMAATDLDQLKRREFITLLGGAATWPLAARARFFHPLAGRVSVSANPMGGDEMGCIRRRLLE